MPQLVNLRLSGYVQRVTENSTYYDEAVYITPADPNTTDEYGQPSGTATETTLACSFTDKPNAERWRGDVDIEQLAAEVRFSSLIPTKAGRVRIIKRFGVDVTEKTFEVIGLQDRGDFGFVCALKAVSL